MPSAINTNVASLNAQRQLATSQSALTTSMQRLSSGLRVNSARDDAAGLAIAERMSAQVRGMNVAVRNANDGISLAQTAEGALGKVGDTLQRMRELAVQARNATNTSSDKDSLDKEFGELAKEIQRLLGGTTFNGKAILGADAGTMSFQVGAGVGPDDVIELQLSNVAGSGAITALTGVAPDPASLSAANTAAVAAAVAYATTHGYAGWAANMAAAYTPQDGAAGSAQALVAAGLQAESLTPALASGISAATSGSQARDITIANLTAGGMLLGNASVGATFYGAMAQAAYEAFAAAAPGQGRASTSGDVGATGAVISDLDAAIDEINNQRATLGATLSRFDSVVANLNISIENQSAARGRIMDSDFAQETANLSRAQILQQAGNAMVAQANQLPRAVLQLLG